MVHRLRLSPLSRIILILCLASPFLGVGHSHAQAAPAKWQPLGGPGGRLTHLVAAANGTDLYAVSAVTVNRRDDQTQWRDSGVPTQSNALYGSTDGGATWLAVTNDLPPGTITALNVDHAGRIWLGLQMREDLPGRRNGLWQSADRGATWRQVALDRNDLVILTIAEAADGNLLFGAVDAGGFEQGIVYRSTDDGASWTARALSASGLDSRDRLAGVVADPAKDGVLVAVTRAGQVLYSGDGAASWLRANGTEAESSASVQAAFLPDPPAAAILVQSSGDATRVLRSADSGASWSPVRATGFPGNRLALRSMLVLPDGVLLLNTDSGTYRSSDGGSRWQPLEGVLSSGAVNAWVAGEGQSVLAATDYGLFASTDAGAVWRSYGTGLPNNSAVRTLLTHKDRPALIAVSLAAPDAADPPELLLTRDSGRTWLPSDGGGAWSDATAWTVDPNNPDNLFVAGANYVAVSYDGGFSWKVQPAPYAMRTSIAVAPSDSSRIYIDGAPQLRSQDGGQTWSELPTSTQEGVVDTRVGLAIDPGDAAHLWNGGADGVWESRDGGASWLRSGLDGESIGWLAATGGTTDQGPLILFAGLANGGLVRRNAGGDWQPLTAGLPANSIITAFVADPRTAGLLWAGRDGGGIYQSTDGGDTWVNAALSMGDNLALALAVNYQEPGSVLVGTASAGVWMFSAAGTASGPTETPASSTPAGAPTSAPTDASGRAGVDARIEVVWPHGFAAIDQAQLANVGIRLFEPRSLQPPSCGWRPKVQLWRAIDNEPAEPVEAADQRSVDGQPFSYWEANDVDVSAARRATSKIYFMVAVDGVDTATSVWAHAVDARTYFPEQQVPSGLATSAVDAVDARIQIVWPHDRQGAEASVDRADLANVAVTLFKHGTRLSVPPSWAGQVTLYGAWNAEVARPLSVQPTLSTRQAGVITFPLWEFNDVPVDRARDGANKLYLWAVATGVKSYPTIWAHGADSRTFFPATDEPIRGCLP